MITALQLPLTGLPQAAPLPTASTADIETRLSFEEILQGLQPADAEALTIVLLAPEIVEQVDAPTTDAPTKLNQPQPQTPARPPDALHTWVLARSADIEMDARPEADLPSAPSGLSDISIEEGEIIPAPFGAKLGTALSLSKGWGLPANGLAETGRLIENVDLADIPASTENINEREPKTNPASRLPNMDTVGLPNPTLTKSLSKTTTSPEIITEAFEASSVDSPKQTTAQKLQKFMPKSAPAQTASSENLSNIQMQVEPVKQDIVSKTAHTVNETVENTTATTPAVDTKVDAVAPIVEQMENAQPKAFKKETVETADFENALEPSKEEDATREIKAVSQASGFVAAQMQAEPNTQNKITKTEINPEAAPLQAQTNPVKETVFSQMKDAVKPLETQTQTQTFSVPATEANTETGIEQKVSTVEAPRVMQQLQEEKAVDSSTTLKNDDTAKEVRNAFPQQLTNKVDFPQGNVAKTEAQPSTQQVFANTETIEMPVAEDSDGSKLEHIEIAGVAQRSVLGRAEVFAEQPGTISVRDTGMNDVDVVDQIFAKLNLKMEGNPSSIRLQLNPEELGEIDIRVKHVAEGIRVSFTAEQPATAQLLEKRIDQLQQAFREAGLTVTDLNIGQQGNFERQGGFQQPRDLNTAMPVSRETVEGKVEEVRSQPKQAGGVDYLI